MPEIKMARLAAVACATILVVFMISSCDRDVGPTAPRTELTIGPHPVPDTAPTLLDEQIDPTDSYGVAEVEVFDTLTLTSDTAMLDPRTGGTATTVVLTPLPDTVWVQSGYNVFGEEIGVTRYTTEPDAPSNAVRLSRSIADNHTDYGLTGESVADSPIEIAEGQSPVATLSAEDIGAVTEALEISEPLEPSPCCSDPDLGTATSSVAPSPSVQVSAPDTPLRYTRALRHRTETEATYLLEFQERMPDGRTRSQTVLHSYHLHGRRWLLREARFETADLGDRPGVRSVQVLRFSNVKSFRNWAKDSVRAARRTARKAANPGMNQSTRAIVSAAQTAALLPATVSTAFAGESHCIDEEFVSTWSGGQGPSIVFQHGFGSGTCTWERMHPDISDAMAFGGEVMINTASFDEYDVQRNQLLSSMQFAGGSGWVFVGHSNGGIVSRRAAQWYSTNQPNSVRGVLTINTPHRGALMVLSLQPALQFFATVSRRLRGLCSPIRQRGCGEVEEFSGVPGTSLGIFARLAPMPVATQMSPASSFHRTILEAAPEPFLRVGFVSHAPDRWQFSRLRGDLNCFPDATYQRDLCPGGNETAHRTDRLYKHLRRASTLAFLSALGRVQRGDWDGATTATANALAHGLSAGALWGADQTFQFFVSGAERDSDAIVNGSSQWYPNAERIVHINAADSHIGATKSCHVINRVRASLRDATQFNVPPKPRSLPRNRWSCW